MAGRCSDFGVQVSGWGREASFRCPVPERLKQFEICRRFLSSASWDAALLRIFWIVQPLGPFHLWYVVEFQGHMALRVQASWEIPARMCTL